MGDSSLYFDVTPGIFNAGIAGNFIDQFYTLVRSGGSYTGHGTEVCASCTIGGRTGTFYARFEFSGKGTQFSGKQCFTRGTGGLIGLEGVGSFQTGLAGNSYSFSYSFDEE